MASVEQHVAAMLGDMALKVAAQAAEIDSLKAQLAAAQAKPADEPKPEQP